jgi:aquaporin Z
MTPSPAGWRAYATEGALLAVFMVSACAFTILVEHPRGLLSPLFPQPVGRRFVVGVAMAITAAVLIYSRPGRRTGAHMNPAVTLALSRLGSMPRRQVLGYIAGHFAGGIVGVASAVLLFGPALSHASVNFVVTRPGPAGAGLAFIAECAMTLVMMSTVLRLSNHPRWSSYTGLASAALLAGFITLVAPLSGMSLNPARTLGPALFANDYSSLWVYFLAPPAGMFLAVFAFTWQCRSGACPHGFHGARYEHTV